MIVCPAAPRRRQIAEPMPPIPPDTKAMRETAGIDWSRELSPVSTGWSATSPVIRFPLCPLAAHGTAHAAADAKRREAALRVALLHLVQQSHEDAAARGADRVAERDRPAVHVDLLRIPAHLPVDR